MDFAGMNVISVDQFNLEGIEQLFTLARRMRPIQSPEAHCEILRGYILGSLFFEESTRTRMSFTTAFLRLGGTVNSIVGKTFSSRAKGETLEDTIRVAQGYCDIIVLRDSEQGSAAIAAECSTKPVINAGDGPGEHPTQALLDLFTIVQERGHVDGLTIALCGDLACSRTVHSLAKLLCLYPNVRIICIAPPEAQIPDTLADKICQSGISLNVTDSLENGIAHADVIYMTRLQKERRLDDLPISRKLEEMYYVLNSQTIVQCCRQGVTIMHPLPRNGEITLDVDTLSGAAYIRQTVNGTLIRMALFALVLEKAKEFP